MSKHVMKSKITVVLSLLIVFLVFASSCDPAADPLTPPSSPLLDLDGDNNGRNEQSRTVSTSSKNTSSTQTSPSSAPSTSTTTESTTLPSNKETVNPETDNNTSGTSPQVTRPTVIDDRRDPPEKLPWTEIFERVNPSVALVRLTIPASTIYGEREETFSALIIDEEGLLISSYSMFERAVDHRGIIVNGATIDIFVNGYTMPFVASLYGFDQMSDIALLKVKPGTRKLTAQQLFQNSEIKVGLPVGVLTSPEDFVQDGSLIPSHVMSVHVPSVREDALPYDLFVSDVPTLNKVPGAPLIDQYGRILGVCSASKQHSYLDYRTYIIPSSVITQVIDSIIEKVENLPVSQGSLGIAVMADDAARLLAGRYGYPTGLHVTCVQLGSPAYTAGLRAGDIILTINDIEVKVAEDLIEFMDGKSVGSYCVMQVYRPSEAEEQTFSCYLQQVRY